MSNDAEWIQVCAESDTACPYNGVIQTREGDCMKSKYVIRWIFLLCLIVGLIWIGKSFFQSPVPAAQDQQQKGIKSSGQQQAKQVSRSQQWQLRLVNEKNPLPEGFQVETVPLHTKGQAFDSRAADYLEKMLEDGEKEGLSFVICSSYRSVARQKELFRQQVAKQKKKGLPDIKAYEEAKTVVALPGTSEHNLGLAADIVSEKYQLLDDQQAQTKEAKWLRENCYKYGFILRYPEDKKDITGIIFEPWHFRYVGLEAATEIMQRGICLEEYLA